MENSLVNVERIGHLSLQVAYRMLSLICKFELLSLLVFSLIILGMLGLDSLSLCPTFSL